MVDVSVIGCGNMGGALARGLAQAGVADVLAFDIDPDAFTRLDGLDVDTTTELGDARDAPYVFVAVKPDLVQTVLEDLDLSSDQTVISIAAGLPTESIRSVTDGQIVRLMPNLAASHNEMAGAVAGTVDETLWTLLDSLGTVVEIREAQMDAATALNGSGPAFVFYLINAMATAGSDLGIDPANARVLAAQTFKGAAETVLDADESIDDLIEAVCSPKGTTIEGMAILRSSDTEATIQEAVEAAADRATELAQEASYE